MRHVFNLGQITQGKTFAQWRTGDAEDGAPPIQMAAVATAEPSPDNEEETKPMSTRSEIRAALQTGPLSRAELEEALKGTDISTPLSQLTKEGQIIRSGKGGEAVYSLGRAPGSIRKTRPAKTRKKKSPKAAVAKRDGPHKVADVTAAPAAANDIAQTILKLRLHRDLVDIAINSLEDLTR